MLTRRALLGRGAVLLVGSSAWFASGCRQSPVLSGFRASGTTLTPNGSGVDDEIDFDFSVNRRADISATLIGSDGKQYVIRPRETKAPNQYQIRFRGAVQLPNSDWMRVIPDGQYTFVLDAQDTSGQTAKEQASFVVSGADTEAPRILNVVVEPATFSPNGDGYHDTVQVSYQLTKKASARVYVTDQAGGFYLVQETKTLDAALQSFQWDGKSNGNVLPDGTYTLHVEATDPAGNFTDQTAPVTIEASGTPRLEILEVAFAPLSIPSGGDLNVQIRVRNAGDTPLATWGPPPSQKYRSDQNFASFRDANNSPQWYEKVGVWRVCVGWTIAAQNYPIRWGFFEDLTRKLQPGEEAIVKGVITVVDKPPSRDLLFYAGIEQGGVGFFGGQVGQQRISVSF